MRGALEHAQLPRTFPERLHLCGQDRPLNTDCGGCWALAETGRARYGIVVYVPASHLEPVKQTMFEAGAGRIGDYDRCAWQIAGLGQFRPLAGSQPFLGTQGQIETVEEVRVEVVC